jgi:hypothetical protein
MGGVVDGQAVSAGVTDPAFIFKNADDIMPNQLGMSHALSGTTLISAQKAINTALDTTGATEGVPGTTYGAPANTILDGDNHQTALTKLANKFSGTPSPGHTHDGINGNGPNINAFDLAVVPLRGFVRQGVDQIGVTGTSTDVSTDMTGKTPSPGAGTPGVVVTAPENKLLIRYASGVNENDQIVDGSGNVVYGRITESSGVWTLSYFVDLSGTETPYSFGSATDVRWYYQELFNPMVNPPTYSEYAVIPSDNATLDVIQATSSEYGKTILQNSASADIGSAGTTGTANGRVANENHVHRGVRSLKKTGGPSDIFGDVELEQGTNVIITQNGQKLNIASQGTEYRAGQETIPSDVDTISVVYSTPMPDSNYALHLQLVNPSDTSPQFQSPLVSSFSTGGFTAKWNVPTDSNNYSLHYTAIENQ